MKRSAMLALSFVLSFISLQSCYGSPEATVDSSAPDFSLSDANGTKTSLSQFKGKTVVLEWFNPNCPFVRKFYAGGQMQSFQKTAREKGAVWLTINSNAMGKPGFIPQDKAAGAATQMGLDPSSFLLDPTGDVGRKYGARTTPHIFVIDAQGTLRYAGAIDSEPSTDAADIPGAKNYALGAVDALAQGKSVSPSTTDPYGCSVKY